MRTTFYWKPPYPAARNPHRNALEINHVALSFHFDTVATGASVFVFRALDPPGPCSLPDAGSSSVRPPYLSHVSDTRKRNVRFDLQASATEGRARANTRCLISSMS